ncbi:ROK family protein [Bacteroidales bacterium OttesenSCG-928-K22]|nr:ROK family protein [Bacteroidales bacterium OttesenSCG-928-L14]MDL2240259.1 ROK family protein [Bacteroidales bacterium OttesenSCG-928-K22]
MSKIVMTLDAGGTNFVFSAIKNAKEIVKPIRLSAKGETLEEILKTIINGFEQVKDQLEYKPAAISFSFPGPAEYELGIIGDLQNLPLFRGGVALGPMLENIFQIPTFINNDGDLFAYGEAIAGLLPEVNSMLEKAGSPKRYKNLLGVTLGTGFGGGIITNGEIYPGDNSAQGEINRFNDLFNPRYSIEESVTIKGIRGFYADAAGIARSENTLEPKDIYEIATGNKEGNVEAARIAFKKMAEGAGNALANAASLTDGLIVIGGGIANAYPLFLDDIVAEMNKPFKTPAGNEITRMEVDAYNLENPEQLQKFLKGNARTITVPFSNQQITYDPEKRIGVGISRLGTEAATSLGAYYYAINHL